MFNITADLLSSILALQSSRETSGAWMVFVREIEKIRNEHVSESLHFVPSPDDVNANMRKELLRGIAICLDVLTGALKNPSSLIEDIENIKKSIPPKENPVVF